MALSPWPEPGSDRDDAVAVLEAALPDGAGSGTARPSGVGDDGAFRGERARKCQVGSGYQGLRAGCFNRSPGVRAIQSVRLAGAVDIVKAPFRRA